jgi:hypothetical protein
MRILLWYTQERGAAQSRERLLMVFKHREEASGMKNCLLAFGPLPTAPCALVSHRGWRFKIRRCRPNFSVADEIQSTNSKRKQKTLSQQKYLIIQEVPRLQVN